MVSLATEVAAKLREVSQPIILPSDVLVETLNVSRAYKQVHVTLYV